jgi:hypothetical protein
MKKLILMFICLISLQVKAQDTISAQDFSPSTNMLDSAQMWFWYQNTGDYRIPATYVAPFKYSPSPSPYIYPRTSGSSLLLGTSTLLSGYTTYPLQVYGNSRFSGKILTNEGLYFDNGSYITSYGTDLSFYSPSYGLVTLSDIINNSGGISGGYTNGLSTYPLGAGIGGNLNRNTTVNLLNYKFMFTSPYINLNLYAEEGIAQLITTNDIYIGSKKIVLTDDYWSLTTGTNLMNDNYLKPIFTDKSAVPVGLQYSADYSANIISEDANEALVSYRLLKQFASDSIEQQISVTGSGRENKLTAFTADTNTIGSTNITYSDGTLHFNPVNDTSIYILQESTVPAISIYHASGDGPSVSILNGDDTGINVVTNNGGTGIASNITTSTNGGTGFSSATSTSSSISYGSVLGNYPYNKGLYIHNNSTYSTTNAIQVYQPSNYPNIFYCANKFRIDGRGIPWIGDTNMYAWVYAHGGGLGGGSGNVTSITTDLVNQIPYYTTNDTVKSEDMFKYYETTNLLVVPSISCSNASITTSTSDGLTVNTASTTYKSSINGYNKILSIKRLAGVQTGTLSDPILEILNESSGTAITTGPMLFIDDKPTSTGTKVYELLKGSVNNVQMVSFFPRTVNGSNTPAYSFNTVTNLTANTKVFSVLNYGVDKFYVLNDSVVVTKNLSCKDSVYLPYAKSGAERWLGLSRTGAVFSDTLTNGGFMLTMKIPTIKEHMEDQKDGEISWYHKDKSGKIIKTYGLTDISPMSQLQALMTAQEQSFRYIEELETKLEDEQKENEDLKNRISIIEQVLLKNSLK